MNKPKILVVQGSLREANGSKVSKFFMDSVKNNPVAEVTFVKLSDFDLPQFADPVNPSGRSGKHENPEVQKWLDAVESSDGFIFITPEYNHSTSSGLKNALDYPFKEWAHKAVGLVGYGGIASGSRAVEHIRQIVTELNMYSVREQVLIPMVWSAFDEKGNLNHGESVAKNSNALLESVSKLAMVLKAGYRSV